MFCVIYAFQVKPGQEETFIQAWEAMTKLIREYEGGWGSRLHRETSTTYIAYAQWPDRNTWKQSGNKLPPEADEVRQQMRASCSDMETLHELEMVADLLKKL